MNTPLTQMVPTHIYQAASVEEAVELAQKFKDEGRYAGSSCSALG